MPQVVLLSVENVTVRFGGIVAVERRHLRYRAW